jgi:outer membrane translocation and assembly module TamA
MLVGAGDLESVPATRRFFAGGGGSVRGYAYQEISPEFSIRTLAVIDLAPRLEAAAAAE